MHRHLTAAFALLALVAQANPAQALEIEAYRPERFAQLQQSQASVALHFHADWCPTCRAQQKVFNGWQGDPSVPGTLLVVDYDKARDLRRQMNVRSQSTVISFKGKEEKARLAGETEAGALRWVLAAGQ